MGIRFVSAFLIAATVLLATLPAKAQVVTGRRSGHYEFQARGNDRGVQRRDHHRRRPEDQAVRLQVDHQFARVDRSGRECGSRGSLAAKDAGNSILPHPDERPNPDAGSGRNKFLEVITTPGVEPAFIHCASGNRAAALWLIKRLKVVDHWKADEALDEAADLGLTNPKLLQWSLHYADAHQKDAHIPGATGPATQQ